MTKWWISSIDHLLEVGYDDLHRNQAELKRVAGQIDPTCSKAEAILQDLENDHPSAGKLLGRSATFSAA